MAGTITHLDPSQVASAGALIARALQEAPVARCLYPDPEERRRASPWFFEGQVRYGLRFGEVHTIGDEIDGVAVWYGPEAPEMDDGAMIEAGLLAPVGPEEAAQREKAVRRATPLIERAEGLHAQHMPSNHWYLSLLAVDPGRQGRGIGGALLEPMLDRLKAQGMPAFLWTAQPRNVAFYEKQGFELLDAETEPRTGVRFWTFAR